MHRKDIYIYICLWLKFKTDTSNNFENKCIGWEKNSILGEQWDIISHPDGDRFIYTIQNVIQYMLLILSYEEELNGFFSNKWGNYYPWPLGARIFFPLKWEIYIPCPIKY